MMRGLAAAGVLVSACSLFVPDDEEYVGGSDTDAGTTGGAAGALGGSSGASGSSGIGGAAGAGGTTSTGGSAGSSGTGGSGGSSGGAGGASGGAGGVGGVGGATGGAGGSGGASCTPGPVTLSPQPTAAYVMLDRTASMSQGSWNDAEQGIQQFLNGASATGYMGLKYFPVESGQGSCTGSGYDTPEVPIAALPGNVNALLQSLGTMGFASFNSPSQLSGVLTGGLSHALAHATQNPDRQVKLVVITDWSGADSCTTTLSVLAGIAQAGAEADPPVRTHLITFSSFGGGSNLDPLAQAGGTEQAIDANTESDVANGLRRAFVPCRFTLPATGTPTSSATLSFGATAQLTEVASAAACQGNQFFLSGTPPTALVLCPDACDAIPISSSPTVELDMSCP